MPVNQETLSVLQKEFAEKLKAYQNNPTPTVSKIAMNIEGMKEYGMDAEDYMQLGPFSCRDLLLNLQINPTMFRENKPLIMGFLADTFTERGFNVNVYSIVPKTGEISVQNIQPVPESQRPDLQLSMWDKFWGFLGIETANAKAIKGFEEAKKNEAQFMVAMKKEVEEKAIEKKKNIAFIPKDTSFLSPEVAQMYTDIEIGNYTKVINAAKDHLRKAASKSTDKAIKDLFTQKRMINEGKIQSLKGKSLNAFEGKFNDPGFMELNPQDQALTLVNIIKNPAVLDAVCTVKFNMESKTVKTKVKDKEGNETTVEKTGRKPVLETNHEKLTDYMPVMSYDLSNSVPTIAEVDEIENENENEL